MNDAHKISPEHVAWLHDFCKRKDIVMIDLRIELVDHLCEMVEARWQNFPNEDFKTAFYAVYKSFGVFGFYNIANQHAKIMERTYWKSAWRYIKTWITPPRIFFTVSVYALLVLLGFLDSRINYAISLAILLFVIGMGVVAIWQYKRNKKILSGEKDLLSFGVRTNGYFIGYFFTEAIIIGKYENIAEMHPAITAAIAVIMSVYAMANFALLNNAKSHLLELKQRMVQAN